MKRLFADTLTHTIVDYDEIDFAYAWAGRYFEIISSLDENFVRETWAVTPDSNTPGIDYLGITMDMSSLLIQYSSQGFQFQNCQYQNRI